jgi:signal transduction histidine kinase
MTSADPREGHAQGDESMRGAGQRDVLLELLSVLAHDLNNPLQTLLVLSELALDESPAGTEPHDRALQCLAAADRLKVLTQAMGATLRGRPLDAAQLWARTAVMLGRRLERYGVAAVLDLAALDGIGLAADAEWALLSAAMAVIATAAASARRRHELSITGKREHGIASVVLALTGFEPDGTRTPLPFVPSALARLCDIVPGSTVTDDGVGVRLVLPV